MRLSNGLVDKVNAVFNIENEWYKATGTGDYAGYALFQRSYGGTVQQDMTGYVINFTDLKYGADKTIVTSNDPQQYYVWDGSKIVNDNNVPNVTFNDSTPTQSPEPTAEPVAKINREGKDVYYQSLKAAIEDAKVNETITPASGSVVITTAENAVLANDITVSGFNFGDGGALTVSGNGAFTITDCKFEATAAGVKTPLNLKNYGKTIVKNNTFGTENDGVYYNAVEFDVGSEVNKNGVKVADGTEISGNHFGKITHNGISIYNVEENATITIKDNIYEISASALRLSNGLVDKVNAIFNIENEWYKTTDPTEGWEGYATLQTVYKNGNPEQDVTGYVLNFKNLYYGDESNKKVAEDGDGVQQIVVWNGTDFATDAEKLPTVSITNDVLPTQSLKQQQQQSRQQHPKQRQQQSHQRHLRQRQQQSRQQHLRQRQQQSLQQHLRQQQQQSRQQHLKQRQQQSRQQHLKQRQQQSRQQHLKQRQQQSRQRHLKQRQQQSRQRHLRQRQQQSRQRHLRQQQQQNRQQHLK